MNEPSKILAPIGGYIVDVLDKLRNRIFVPHSLTKLHNIRTLRALTGATSVIEVGTFRGVTARRLSYVFPRVVTIEIDEALHRQAKTVCAGRPNVELLLGDGSVLLPGIVAKETKTIIFLDGHFSGAGTGMGDEPEPVLKELDGLDGLQDRIAGVLIDDFRLFGVESGWPKKSEVFDKLEQVFKGADWRIAVLNDQVFVYRSQPGARPS